jgi:hypothetical protein
MTETLDQNQSHLALEVGPVFCVTLPANTYLSTIHPLTYGIIGSYKILDIVESI